MYDIFYISDLSFLSALYVEAWEVFMLPSAGTVKNLHLLKLWVADKEIPMLISCINAKFRNS